MGDSSSREGSRERSPDDRHDDTRSDSSESTNEREGPDGGPDSTGGDSTGITGRPATETPGQRSAMGGTSSAGRSPPGDSEGGYLDYDPGPDHEALSKRYGTTVVRGEAGKLQQLENEFGNSRVQRWVDEGMPVEVMGKPRDMKAFRKEQDENGDGSESADQGGSSNGSGEQAVQPKLEVSSPDDPAEREAEEVAETVMEMETPTDRVAEKEGTAQRDTDGGVTVSETVTRLPGGTEKQGADESTVMSGIQGSGKPLPSGVRSDFEAKLGADFSDVSIHTGPSADEAARSIGAEAFTVGGNVAFASGAYQPETKSGKQLLAHELTHVVQQGAAPSTDSEGSDAARSSRVTPRLDGTTVLRQARSTLIDSEYYDVQVPSSRAMSSVDVHGEVESRLDEFNLGALAVNVITSRDGTVTWYFIDLEQQSGVAVTEEEVGTAWAKLSERLTEAGFPQEFRDHVQAKLEWRSEFALAPEYQVWSEGATDATEWEEDIEREDEEPREATIPPIDEMKWWERTAIRSLMGPTGIALQEAAEQSGYAIAVGLSGGIGLGGGVGAGGGVVFFPDSSIGLFGSAEASGGLDISAGVSLDFLIVDGGPDVFGGTAYSVNVLLFGISGHIMYDDVTMVNGEMTFDQEDMIGVGASGGPGLGIELATKSAEKTGFL